MVSRGGKALPREVPSGRDVVPVRRLEWHRTYPGIGQDYTAKIDGGFARVHYAVNIPGDEKWHWTASRSTLIDNGYVRTAEEGVRLAEEALLGPAGSK